MNFELPNAREYERALKLCAVLYLREQHLGYINYMARTKAFAAWLLPGYEESYSFDPKHRTAYATPDEPCIILHYYELQELQRIWSIDVGGCYQLLRWAQRDIRRYDSSNTQTSLPF